MKNQAENGNTCSGSTSPAQSASRHCNRFCFVTGSWGERIGGPWRTVRAYREVVGKHGAESAVFSTSNLDDDCGSSSRTLLRSISQIIGVFPTVRAAVRWNPDVVIFVGVWHAMFLLGLPLICARLRGARIILIPTQSLSPVDWQKHFVVKRLLRPYVSACISKIDRIIFATRGEMLEALPPCARGLGTVVYHPYSGALPAFVTRSTVSSKEVCITCRVHPQKDLELALRAIALLPGVALRVIGDGEPSYVGELKRLASELGIEERVIWSGWMDHDAAVARMTHCSALLVTSRAENYCHSAVEAMALGVPVVMVNRIASSFDFSSLGLVKRVQPTPRSVADGILWASESGSIQTAMTMNARHFAEERASDKGMELVWNALLPSVE